MDGTELWIKRDDLTGLEGGGNKTRKLEFLVGDAIETGADMLVTVGAIQSNHTRQTAAAAAKCKLKCALLHIGWTEDAGPMYRQVGNILLSSIMGAELFLDETVISIEDQSPLTEFGDYLEECGHVPYLIPPGASEHRLGSLGYMSCAAEIVRQSMELDVHFDYVVHCSGSGSTQAGLVAGFAALGEKTRVIGVSDDDETHIKEKRVIRLSNDALAEIGMSVRVSADDVAVIAEDKSPYGVAETETFDAIRLLARTEGLVADPASSARHRTRSDRKRHEDQQNLPERHRRRSLPRSARSGVRARLRGRLRASDRVGRESRGEKLHGALGGLRARWPSERPPRPALATGRSSGGG